MEAPLLGWSVKVENAEFTDLGEHLHKILNKQKPADVEDAAELVQRETGARYIVSRSNGRIGVHPLRRRLGASPQRVVTITRKTRRPTPRWEIELRTRWGKAQTRCPECRQTHDLSYVGRTGPIIYGYVCPRTGQVVVFRIDHMGWTRDYPGTVRTFAIAVPRETAAQ